MEQFASSFLRSARIDSLQPEEAPEPGFLQQAPEEEGTEEVKAEEATAAAAEKPAAAAAEKTDKEKPLGAQMSGLSSLCALFASAALILSL